MGDANKPAYYPGEFYFGLDLGQARDFTALAIVERVTEAESGDLPDALYLVRHLERFQIGTSYPEIVESVKKRRGHGQLKDAVLVVDYTGVGRPVVDMLRDAGLNPEAVTITGGDRVGQEDGAWRVPKRDLVGILQVLLQQGRLKFAGGLPEVPTLIRELQSFQVKISLDTAHDSYGAWREGAHDDLVLAISLAVWFAETGRVKWYMF